MVATRMITQPIFRDRNSGKPIAAISHTKILKSSDALKWEGLQLEIARTHGWKVDDLMVEGHLLCLNLSDRDLQYRIRNETDCQSVRLVPQSFWILPEGKPFSIHHDEDAYYASIFINGKFLDEVTGHHAELRAGNGVVDEVLAGIGQSLIGILTDRYAYNEELANRLIRAFVFALAQRHGYPAAACIKGGIAPAQLKHLLAWLEINLHGSLSGRAMAARVGLSAAHFSREFKRSTGRTPWEYVVDLRLEGARRLLEAGGPVSEAALHFGFSDQSHLSRLFKLKYGETPSSFVKTHRGWYSA